MTGPGRAIILNVDDYPPGLYARTRILRQAGFEVREASTGCEAVRLALGEQPDLVLLDVNLPDIDGFEVCRQIKANPRTASVLVLHLSATKIREGDRIRGLETGADGYLVEPIGRSSPTSTRCGACGGRSRRPGRRPRRRSAGAGRARSWPRSSGA
jgi:DNA-binding response OmpR family regulator